jgi:NTE family protein
MNSIFLDLLDNDAMRLERLNRLIRVLPPEQRQGLAPVKLLVLRPSQDLGKLASNFEYQLPRSFRFLTRGLGTRETKSPDFLSLVLFQPDYVRALIEIGEQDANAHVEDVASFLESDAGVPGDSRTG